VVIIYLVIASARTIAHLLSGRNVR